MLPDSFKLVLYNLYLFNIIIALTLFTMKQWLVNSSLKQLLLKWVRFLPSALLFIPDKSEFIKCPCRPPTRCQQPQISLERCVQFNVIKCDLMFYLISTPQQITVFEEEGVQLVFAFRIISPTSRNLVLQAKISDSECRNINHSIEVKHFLFILLDPTLLLFLGMWLR